MGLYKQETLTSATYSYLEPGGQSNNNDNVGTLQVAGTFTTAVGSVQVSYDPLSTAAGSATWVNVDLQREDTFSIENTPTFTNSTARSWKFCVKDAQRVRINIASGTITSMVTTLITSYQPNNPLQGVGAVASVSGALTITSASATALAVGPNGTTNPTLLVVSSTTNAAGGLSITGAADAAGVALAGIGSNTNEPLTLDAKGSGLITIGSVSTGGAVVYIKTATVAATGSAIGNAAAVGLGYSYVTASDNTKGVILPASIANKQVTVKNTVATALLLIYPPVNSQINAKGVNNVYNIPNAAERTFTCVSTTLWYTAPETIV